MKAATFQGIRRISVEEKPCPRIVDASDALVEVELAGLCGSDLHPYRGNEVGLDAGTTTGHEFTGRVVEVGADVARLNVGDLVLGPFTTSCSACAPCRRGLSSRCRHGALFGWVQNGLGLEGGQAGCVRVPLADTTLVQRKSALNAAEAVLLGDVVSTGFYIASRARVGPSSAVAVLGLGGVGLSAILACREFGAETVVGLDSVRERLALAESFGAHAVPITNRAGQLRSPSSLGEEVRRLLGGEGASEVLEAVGSEDATRLAVEILRPGGTLSIAGVHTEKAFAVSPVLAYDKNLALMIGRCPVRSGLDALCEKQIAQRLPIEKLITHRIPLEEAADAYRMFDAREDGCIKVVFEP